jgi:hypothetical protein
MKFPVSITSKHALSTDQGLGWVTATVRDDGARFVAQDAVATSASVVASAITASGSRT